MSSSRSLGHRIFGGRWSLAEQSPKPAWVQIEEQLADRIEAAALAPGERLPPERELADVLGVSRMTVRQALASLAARGLVERGVGRGTFVRQTPKITHDLMRIAGFTEQLARHGLEVATRILNAMACPAPDHVAQSLGIAPGDLCVRLERVRSAGGRPFTLEDSWLPDARFPDLLAKDLTGSLYALLHTTYDRGPRTATEQLEPVVARAYEARALEVPEGSPLMLVERVAYAADGTPVEFARDRHRGDRARFLVRIVPDDVLAREH